MLTRPSNFDNAYSSSSFITSSNIYIEDKDNNTLLTKDNLGEYKCSSRSSFLNESLPMEDTTFVVLDWKNIPQATKTYLTTRHNVIYVKYEVNNVKSTGARFCLTDSAKIDFNGEKATIKCVSPVNTLGGTALMGSIAQYGYSIFNLIYNLSYGDNQEQIFLRSQGVSSAKQTRNAWFVGTNAEMVQNGLIALGGGLRYNTNYYNLDSTRGQIVSMGNAYNNRVSFDPVNIHEDIDKDVLNLPTTGRAYGYTLASERLIVDGSVRPTSTTYTTTTTIKDHCRITRATLTGGSGSPTLSTITQTNNSDGTSDVYMRFTGCTPSSNYVLSIYGQDIVEPTIQNIDGEVAGYSKLLEGNESRVVYNTELSFSCRINPCIEVLDCLQIRNVGLLYVEQVDIEFNGAYRGKIVGKLNENLYLSLTKTINSETNYTITFSNNCPFDGELYIGNTSIGSITANATKTYHYGDNATLDSLVADSIHQVLLDDVDVVMKSGNKTSNAITLFIQSDSPYNPIRESFTHDQSGDRYEIKVRNPNSYAMTLRIQYADGEVEYDIGANATLSLTETTAPELAQSVQDYAYEALDDDVICWLINKYNTSIVSGNTILIPQI